MKTYVLLLLACLCTSIILAQPSLSSDQWQEDLRFFQKTVHRDFPFLFKKVTAAAFDEAVDQLHRQIPDLEEHEIVVGFARMVALFKYGHTNMGLSGWYDRGPITFHQAPLNLYQYSDGIYVQGVHQDYKQALGAKVIKVAGMDVAKALQAIYPVVPAENEQYFKAFGINYLGTPEILHAQGVTPELKTTVTFTLEANGRTFDVTFDPIDAPMGFPGKYSHIQQEGEWLDARNQNDTPLYLKNLDRIYFDEYLPEQKALYVRHSQIQDDPQEAIPAFYERVFTFIEENEVERFILDVRLNGGGNNYKNKPIVTGVIKSKINKTGQFFVILGRRTFSACQNLVNELSNYTNVIFVGEPTAENINFYGDNQPVELPNSGISIRLSFAWWQDKPQWEDGPWMPPHLPAEGTFEDYQTNRDPALEVALHFSDSTFVLDPMAHFTALFEAGKFQEIQSEAIRLTQDERYRYYPFEERTNHVAYNLLNNGQMEPAIMVFQMNTQLFPQSAKAWNSLAEAFWKAGKKDKAIEYFNKAMSLDPDGDVGSGAQEWLKRIHGGE